MGEERDSGQWWALCLHFKLLHTNHDFYNKTKLKTSMSVALKTERTCTSYFEILLRPLGATSPSFMYFRTRSENFQAAVNDPGVSDPVKIPAVRPHVTQYSSDRSFLAGSIRLSVHRINRSIVKINERERNPTMTEAPLKRATSAALPTFITSFAALKSD